MRGYEDYEDLDEYETEGEEYGEDEASEDDYQEEEDPKLTKEQLEYLEYRQKVKERLRKQSGSAAAKSRQTQRKDSFGSFFGPSQPVIASRVLQEGKALLEKVQDLDSKKSSSRDVYHRSGQTTGGSQSRQIKPPKAINPMQQKLQRLKDTRDYSFLLSDDAELSSTRTNHLDRMSSVHKSEAKSVQVPSSSNSGRQLSAHHKDGRPIANGKDGSRLASYGRDERKLLSNGLYERTASNGRDDRRAAPNGRDERRPASNGRDERRPASNGRDERRPASNCRDERRPASNCRDERRPVSNGREDRRPPTNGRDERRPISNGREEKRQVSSGREERRLMPNSREEVRASFTNGKMPSKMMPPKASASKHPQASLDPRKQNANINGSGPGRPVKHLSSRPESSTVDGKLPASSARSSVSSMQRLPSSKSNLALAKQSSLQKNVLRDSNRAGLIQKQTPGSSNSQVKKPAKPISSSTSLHNQHVKKRPPRPYADEDEVGGQDISNMIRSMFGYNPNRYADDEDDSDMEAGFDDILAEEKRSAKIARQEDERELRLIEEEERRERMRREAKKRKLGH